MKSRLHRPFVHIEHGNPQRAPAAELGVGEQPVAERIRRLKIERCWGRVLYRVLYRR